MADDYFADGDASNAQDSAPTATAAKPNGRSIRNITVPASRTARKRPAAGGQAQRSTPPTGNTPGSHGRSRFAIWGIAGVSVILLIVAISILFLRDTTVTVVPREHTVVFDSQSLFSAAPTSEDASAGLVYTVVTHSFDSEREVEATSVEQVEDRASGTIEIVNAHTEDPVRLIKNTRFETPAGLVYRVRDSVVVPGMSGNTPGTIEVTVFADEPGDRYNIGVIDRFTLPGLRTSAPDMFDNVYARSVTSMTGGFIGERPVVEDSEQEATREVLRDELRASAEEQFTAAVQENYVFAELLEIRFVSLAPEFDESGSVIVREQAEVSAPVISKLDFAKAIAAATSADAGEGNISITDSDTFTIAVADENGTSLAVGAEAIDFTLTGTARFVWEVDAEGLVSDLAGKEKESFQAILENYPGIDTADARVQPPWSSAFPSDPTAIVVTVKNPQ